MFQDLRYACRQLRKTPGFAASAILTLALAIGANSAIFSAVRAVLLDPAAIRDPEKLVVCWGSDTSRNLPVVELSYSNFEEWRALSGSFVQAAAVGSSNWSAVLDAGSEPVRVWHAGVSASFFDTLGVNPLLGRAFSPEDDLPRAPRVVILSYGMWVRRFGANPRIVGTTIRLDDELNTIVGVMPREFDFPQGAEFWTPVVPVLAGADGGPADGLRNVGVLFVIGRLRDGITSRMATAELRQIAERLEESGAPRFGTDVIVTPFLDHVLGPIRPALWALFGAVGVLLLIASANVSGLLLTRVWRRRRELAIRLALGATTAGIGRLWALEVAVLALAGGTFGCLASIWIGRAIVALAPPDIPRIANISIDAPVILFTFAVMSGVALLCGAGPIRLASSWNLAGRLDITASRSFRSRSYLLVLQMALAVVLLVTAGLVVRSFIKLRQIDLGFDPSGVVMLQLGPRDPRPSANEWVRELLSRISVLPEVEAAGAIYLRPLALGPIGQETGIVLEGQPETREASRENPTLNYQVAAPGYFEAMRVARIRGRFFAESDTSRSPRVVIIGETAARRLWPGQDPIGKRLSMPTFAADGPPTAWRTVVGVVSDVRYRGLDDVRLDIYDPAGQASLTASDLAVRTSGDPLRVVAAIQARARALDPGVVIDNVSTLDAIVARAMAPWAFSGWLLSLCAAAAFGLAAFGLFSLVTLDVAERRREFAIRLAVGAARRDIVRTVVASAAWRAVAGVVVGMAAAVAAARAVRSLLFGIESVDVATFGGVLALVLLVVAIAAYLPARRAATVDPLELLRIQ